MGLQIPPTLSGSAPSKRIRRKSMGFQIPPTFCISQLPQKESSGILWSSRSRQHSASAPQKESGEKLWVSRFRQVFASASSLNKNPAENYGAPSPANFLHQPAPSKRIRRKTMCSRSRQHSASAPSKRIRQNIMGFQIPPTFFISSLKAPSK